MDVRNWRIVHNLGTHGKKKENVKNDQYEEKMVVYASLPIRGFAFDGNACRL